MWSYVWKLSNIVKYLVIQSGTVLSQRFDWRWKCRKCLVLLLKALKPAWGLHENDKAICSLLEF